MSARAQYPVENAIFHGIIARCENPNRRCYARYGGRGIRMCAEWRRSFAAFISHVGPRPSPQHSIERIDNDGDYEPGNVRWATATEQNANRRNTRRVLYRGSVVPLADAIRRAGSVVHIETAWIRISRSGWPVEAAVETARLHRSPNARAGTSDARVKYGLAGPVSEARA